MTDAYAAHEPVRRARAGMTGFVVLLAAAGGLLGALAVLRAQPVFLLPAVPCLGVAWMLHAAFVASSRLARSMSEADGTLTIALRRDFPAAAATACLSITAAFAALGLLVNAPAARVLFVAFAVLSLVPVPDLISAAVRGGRLTVTPTRLEYIGWTYVGTVELDDVDGCRLQAAGQRLVMVVGIKPGSPPPAWRRRKLVIPLEEGPTPTQVYLPANAFAEPWKVSALLSETSQRPADHRTHFHTTVVVPWAAGQAPGTPGSPGSPGAGLS